MGRAGAPLQSTFCFKQSPRMNIIQMVFIIGMFSDNIVRLVILQDKPERTAVSFAREHS